MIEWRDIPGFPDHQASSDGQVRRKTNGKGRASPGHVHKQTIRPNGYAVVSISGRKHFVHRLVCAAFWGATDPSAEASHENGQKADNSADNLRWRTRRENEALKVKHGTLPMGSGHYKTDLCEADVITIRSAYRIGLANRKTIAAHFGLTRGSIGDIINRRTWRHVE